MPVTVWAGGMNDAASISGFAAFLPDSEIVCLKVERYGNSEAAGSSTNYQAKVENHSFHFSVACYNEPVYYSISFSSDTLNNYPGLSENQKSVRMYLLEKNDKIWIHYSPFGISFSGKGAEKMSVYYELKRLSDSLSVIAPTNYFLEPVRFKSAIAFQNVLADRKLKYLLSKRNGISDKAFHILSIDLISAEASSCFLRCFSLPDSLRERRINFAQQEIDFFSVKLDSLKVYKAGILSSFYYAKAQIEQYLYCYCFKINKPFTFYKTLSFFENKYSGSVRDKLIISLFYYYSRHSLLRAKYPQNLAPAYNRATSMVKTSEYVKLLKALNIARFKEGSAAYNFTLTDEHDSWHRLSDFKNKIVVLDYWFTGCGNCVLLGSVMKVIEEQFSKEANVIFLTVSSDEDKNTWLTSVREELYTTPFSINLFTGGKGSTHPVFKEYGVTSAPTLIIIDRRGNIYKSPVDPRIDQGKDLIEKIRNALLDKG